MGLVVQSKMKRPTGVDVGRIVAVGILTLLTAVNALSLRGRFVAGDVTFLDFLVSSLTLGFYVLLTIAYLRRSRSSATDHDWRAWLVAFLGTASSFVIPLVAGGITDSGVLAALSAAVMACGLALMLWSLFYLGTNISMVPQARAVVSTGPYAVVRHPLYAAELLTVLGLCISLRGLWPWVMLAAEAALQYRRARNEERLLERELIGYAEYRARTPMILPLCPVG